MPSFDFSYEYDGAGNRTKKINNLTSEVTTYVYDSANQLISMEGPEGTTTFDWDAAGNMIAKHAPEGTTTYTWDYRNRLTQVAPPVGDPINFAYNAMGQRIQKNGTRFVYDGVQLLQETDLNNQTLRSNTFTNEGYGDLVSENNGTNSSFPTFNGQSSTDAIVNNTATVTDRFSYSAFGGQDSQTGSSTTPFRFVGKQSYYNDAETGLYLLGAGGNPNGAGRYYDPELGRFISRDPIGLAGGDVNLYRYARNNPATRIDPSGLDWHHWFPSQFIARISKACGTKLDIDAYTSWVDGSMKTGDAHWWLHNVWGYNRKFERILDNCGEKDCCCILLDALELIFNANSAWRNQFHPGKKLPPFQTRPYPRKFPGKQPWNQDDFLPDGKIFRDICDPQPKCGAKRKSKPNPYQDTMPWWVPREKEWDGPQDVVIGVGIAAGVVVGWWALPAAGGTAATGTTVEVGTAASGVGSATAVEYGTAASVMVLAHPGEFEIPSNVYQSPHDIYRENNADPGYGWQFVNYWSSVGNYWVGNR